jgi:hypothetical protein
MCHDADTTFSWAEGKTEDEVKTGLLHLSEISSSMDDFSGTQAQLQAMSKYILKEAKGGTQ